MSLKDFSIFQILGKTEQEMKTLTQAPLDFWVRQVRQTKDPAAALSLLNSAEEWTAEQKVLIIKGMLTLNLVSFLTQNKVDFLDYDGWRKYMEENPFAPAVTLEVPKESVMELSVYAMKILRPRVTRDMVRSGRTPKPQKLLGSLLETWVSSEEEKRFFFIGWAIYATVMKTQDQASMSLPLEKKAVSAEPEVVKAGSSSVNSDQVCDLNDVMNRVKKDNS